MRLESVACLGATVGALCAAIFLSAASGSARAETVECALLATRVAVNPSAADDIRFLWRFQLPESTTAGRIVVARLYIPAPGEEVPAVVAQADGQWGENSDWPSLASAITGFVSGTVRMDLMKVSSNASYGEATDAAIQQYEFIVTESVKAWVTGAVNNGFWFGRIPGTSDDLRAALGPDLSTSPRLEIVLAE